MIGFADNRVLCQTPNVLFESPNYSNIQFDVSVREKKQRDANHRNHQKRTKKTTVKCANGTRRAMKSTREVLQSDPIWCSVVYKIVWFVPGRTLVI